MRAVPVRQSPTPLRRSPRAWRRGHGRSLSALALVVACLALGACSSCGSDSGGAAASASAKPVDLAPVPAPAELLADLYVPHPGKTWKSFRDVVGGPILLLPASYQVLSTTLLGLAPQVAGLIDEDVPVVGALVNGSDAAPHLVFGLHVRNPRELVANLVTGSDAKFRDTTDAKSGMHLLEAVPGRASNDVRMGIVGSYLLASKDLQALTSAGPYVARTLPKRPVPTGGVVMVASHAALTGPIATHVKTAWKAYQDKLEAADRAMRAQHGGKAPDFADPGAALLGAGAAVDGLVQVLATANELTLVVDPLEGRVEARLELSPETNGAAAELVGGMVVGPMDGLVKLPRSTGVGFETKSTAASREQSARSTGDALAKLFGDRLKAADRKKLDGVLTDLARGRGDEQSVALVSGGAGSGVVLRTHVADAEAFARGVKGGFGLLALPAFSAPLESFVGKVGVTLSTRKIAGVGGKVQRALVTIKRSGSAPDRQTPALADSTTKIEALWTIDGGVAYGAAGTDAAPVLAELVAASADPAASLAQRASEVQAVERMGKSVMFGLVADPQKVGMAAPGGAAAPIVIAVGRGDGHAWLRLELPQAALRGMLRFAMHRGPT